MLEGTHPSPESWGEQASCVDNQACKSALLIHPETNPHLGSADCGQHGLQQKGRNFYWAAKQHTVLLLEVAGEDTC